MGAILGLNPREREPEFSALLRFTPTRNPYKIRDLGLSGPVTGRDKQRQIWSSLFPVCSPPIHFQCHEHLGNSEDWVRP